MRYPAPSLFLADRVQSDQASALAARTADRRARAEADRKRPRPRSSNRPNPSHRILTHIAPDVEPPNKDRLCGPACALPPGSRSHPRSPLGLDHEARLTPDDFETFDASSRRTPERAKNRGDPHRSSDGDGPAQSRSNGRASSACLLAQSCRRSAKRPRHRPPLLLPARPTEPAPPPEQATT